MCRFECTCDSLSAGKVSSCARITLAVQWNVITLRLQLSRRISRLSHTPQPATLIIAASVCKETTKLHSHILRLADRLIFRLLLFFWAKQKKNKSFRVANTRKGCCRANKHSPRSKSTWWRRNIFSTSIIAESFIKASCKASPGLHFRIAIIWVFDVKTNFFQRWAWFSKVRPKEKRWNYGCRPTQRIHPQNHQNEKSETR